MSKILREPLLHFLLIGAALFVVFGVVNDNLLVDADNRVVISAGRIAQLENIFTKTWQRPPTTDELEGLIDDFILEEIYYRQAVAMGIDRDDTVIRRRLRQKFEFLTDDLAAAAAPGDEELASYLAANPEDSPIKGSSDLQRTMRRRLTYPFCTRSHIQYPNGQDHIIHISIAPVSARKSQFIFLFSRNFDHHVAVEELLAWEEKILSEDRGIIEAQKPEEIPLELANEVHVRADKASVALRKWMIDQGLGNEFTA